MFDFEWTGRVSGDQSDRDRGITAAQHHCEEMGYNPAQIWAAAMTDEIGDGEDWAIWHLIERRAIANLARGWKETPENVSLIWR